jgi:RNA polymerase sporulation-specific sigma factor
MNNMEELEISKLILEVRQGNDDAFSALFLKYTPMIRKLVSGFSFVHIRRDEAFCEASVAFYKATLSYDLNQSSVTFGLYSRICVYRKLCDLSRKDNVRKEIFSDVDIETLSVPSHVEAKIIGNERMTAMLELSRSLLSEYEYEVFLLYFKGYTTADVAQLLQKTPKSIDNAKARLLKRLRDESDSFSDIF